MGTAEGCSCELDRRPSPTAPATGSSINPLPRAANEVVRSHEWFLTTLIGCLLCRLRRAPPRRPASRSLAQPQLRALRQVVQRALFDLAVRQRIGEIAAVGFGEDPPIEHDGQPAVGARAYQPPEPRAETQDGLRQRVPRERVVEGFGVLAAGGHPAFP